MNIINGNIAPYNIYNQNHANISFGNNNELATTCTKPINRTQCVSIIPTSRHIERGQINLGNGIAFNRNVSFYCRGDIDWKDFGKYLKEKFKNIENVNIQCFACSKGQEAYSLAILLNHMYENASFKINASDIDKNIISENISDQKSGVFIDYFNFNKIYKNLGLRAKESKKYFSLCTKNEELIQINPKITNSVEFRRKNILDSIDYIDKTKPCLIMCRNMWPYINPLEYSEFAKKLYENLPENSIVVIGDYDWEGEKNVKNSDKFPQALIKNNFKPVKRGIGKQSLMENNNRIFIFEK